MPAPYDYSIGQVANPAQSFLQGIQMGDILRKREEDQAAAIEAKRAAAQRQAFMSQLMAKASAGTIKPADYEQLTMLDPANYKAWSESIGRMNTAQKEAGFANMSGVYSALAMGTPEGVEVARRDLQTQLQAAENSEPQKVQTIKATLAQLDDPVSRSQLLIQSGVTLNGLDPERFKKLTENVAAQRAAPFAQKKIEAEAEEAAFKAKQTETAVKEATIKLQRLDAIQAAELAKAQSLADQERVKAKYADRMAKADLDLKNAQRQREEYQLTLLKADADKGPTPVFNAQAGGFVVSPTKANPKGGFIPLNAIVDNQQQQSAVKALKVAGYDPVTGEDRISKLIEKSTGGVAQALGTEALRAFGFTTEGRKAINELETTANSIVLALMDGKLGAGISNTDRDFITSQLGDVGNPKKPAAERLAGWTAAKNRMITSGMLPPPTGSQPSKDSTPSAQTSNYKNMSDAELMQLLRK